MRKMIISFAFILLTVCWIGETSATIISFLGNNGTDLQGSFSGDLSYTAINANTATLTISLANTSPTANGGYLTAFVFNNPGNDITAVTLASTPAAATFQLLGASSGDKHSLPGFQNTISAFPYGNFDIGASTGRSFLGGGSPETGIAPGQSVTFTFSLTGNHLNDLTSLSFVNELSYNLSIDSQFFAARFRGFNNGISDKVPGFSTGPVNGTPAPLPSTLILTGSALAGMAAFRRLRRP